MRRDIWLSHKDAAGRKGWQAKTLKPEDARKLIDACKEPGLKFALYCGPLAYRAPLLPSLCSKRPVTLERKMVLSAPHVEGPGFEECDGLFGNTLLCFRCLSGPWLTFYLCNYPCNKRCILLHFQAFRSISGFHAQTNKKPVEP